MAHWTERLYREQADVFAEFMDRRFDRAGTEVDALLGLLETEHDAVPDSVLDVACGIGRHAVAFADAGARVTGVDLSPSFIDEARDRAVAAGVADRVDFRVGDMREAAEWDGAYDLITLFWNSLGYYDRATDREVLAGLRRLLSPEGRLVIESSHLATVLREYEPTGVREFDDRLHVERREFEPATGRFHTTIDVFRTTAEGYAHVDTVEFSPRLYAPVELRALCTDAGFETVRLYGTLDGDALTADSTRVVVVAGGPADAHER